MDRGMRTFSLASLAVSVSAAALIGVSNVAEADPPGCNFGYECSELIFFPGEGAFFVQGYCDLVFGPGCACNAGGMAFADSECSSE